MYRYARQLYIIFVCTVLSLRAAEESSLVPVNDQPLSDLVSKAMGSNGSPGPLAQYVAEHSSLENLRACKLVSKQWLATIWRNPVAAQRVQEELQKRFEDDAEKSLFNPNPSLRVSATLIRAPYGIQVNFNNKVDCRYYLSRSLLLWLRLADELRRSIACSLDFLPCTDIMRSPLFVNLAENNIGALASLRDLITTVYQSSRMLAASHLYPIIYALDMADNRITYIEPGVYDILGNGLRKLSLARNNLRSLPAGSFAGLRRLRSLKLDQNQLSTIVPEAFIGLTNLRKLQLSHNNLTSIDKAVIAWLVNLKTLKLTGNPLDEDAMVSLRTALPPGARLEF